MLFAATKGNFHTVSRRQRRKKSKGTFIAIGLPVLLIGGAIVGWATFTFGYAQSYVVEHDTTSIKADGVTGIKKAVADRIGIAEFNVETKGGNNLDIYVASESWRNVLFLDLASVGKIGRTWCAGVSHWYLPEVRVRQINDGRVFATYSCVLDNTTANSP